MTKIYTKTGDLGQTGLWGGDRVPKDHPRVRAYGEVDELNSALGAAIASLPSNNDFAALRSSLAVVQEELFVAGALLATPPKLLAKLTPPLDKIPAGAAERLEREIDKLTADLKPLKKFILPGGSLPGSLFHLARTVCRRAERECVSLEKSETLPDGLIVYLNRLSDHLFTVARWVNHKLKHDETQWEGLCGRA